MRTLRFRARSIPLRRSAHRIQAVDRWYAILQQCLAGTFKHRVFCFLELFVWRKPQDAVQAAGILVPDL
jgi:hypothetical protein